MQHQQQLTTMTLPLLQLGGQRPPSTMIESVSAAISSDPSFTAALAEMISSIIGAKKGGDDGNNNNASDVEICDTTSLILLASTKHL
jgi:hypothetical protein